LDVDLIASLAADPRLNLTEEYMRHLIADPLAFVGDGHRQVDRVCTRIAEVVVRHPEAAAYRPGAIL
jgi:adenylosuccinate lyase